MSMKAIIFQLVWLLSHFTIDVFFLIIGQRISGDCVVYKTKYVLYLFERTA